MLRNDFLQADGQPPPLSLFGQKPKKKRKQKSGGKRGTKAWGKHGRAWGFHEDSDDDWVPEIDKESTTGRGEIGRREEEWEEVLLGDSCGQSEVPSEEIWLPESTVDSDEDQAGVNWLLLFVQ